MREVNALVISNEKIAKDVFRLVLESDLAKELLPGHFVNIQIEGHFLRRPISISSIGENHFTIIYKVIGSGTKRLSEYQKGQFINVLGSLGRFFSIHEDLERVLLIGGGVGVPPLYEVAKRYRQLDKEVVAVLGFRSSEDLFLKEEFRALGVKVFISTDDGSEGFHGNVIDCIKENNIDIDFVYCVGPKPMLKACQDNYEKGYISLEELMACGMGACMGCVCKDKNTEGKYYRVCKEGPVFEIGKVII